MTRIFLLLFFLVTSASAQEKPEEPSQEDVRIVQQALTDEAYQPGSIDGKFGRITAAAIRRYQADWKLKRTGKITYELIQRVTRKHVVTKPRRLIVDGRGCLIDMALPQAREKITYDGLCENQFLNGEGKRVWRYMHRGKWAKTTYEGHFVDGKRHGFGKFTDINGLVYKGEWKNDMRNGQGVFTWSRSVRYDGEWRDGVRHGRGVYIWGRGNRYDGEWVNGKKHGLGVHTWSKGNRHEGLWRDDQKNGQGVFTSGTGDRYEGEFLNGEWNGKGTTTFADGGRYGGEYRDGLQHGYGIYTTANGEQSSGNWHEGDLVISE